MAAPLCWYKARTEGHCNEDDKSVLLSLPPILSSSHEPPNPAISLDKYPITQPVFFGGAKQDYVCLSQIGIVACTALCKDLTIKEFDTGHWLPLEAPQALNSELLAWIEGMKSKL